MPKKATAVSILPYGIAAAAIGVTLLARWLLQPALQNNIPYLIFVLPVSLSAWYGGFRPGLFATILSALVAEFFFVPPYLSVKIHAGVDTIQFIMFLFVGGLISWLSEKRLVEARAAKRSDDLLHETGQHLEALVEASPLAIIVVNDKAQVQLWNPAAERIFGWLSVEVIGRQMPIIPAEKLTTFQSSFRVNTKAAKATSIRETEVSCLRKNGSSLSLKYGSAFTGTHQALCVHALHSGRHYRPQAV
jgi:PAS domain S-box-containing protein